ncbi:dihydrolipoyl dehydrogenase [Spirochaeta isovalerica]|uniref:Dihydrolipoyl dehydrogenase n=1 Tax=Spirochaeta isovalerica TaxID=150 RepID=A0A841R452_9SPIO|nr:dihydrolipoyl dehydrogenase [Spirochaeta isovalerica]MBB6478596.1 dihydrolipoamide dehydrogenase [Spirochaeta isovalerica]
MNNTTYDLIIIGSGPGGYVGAIRASQLGLKSCIIEKDKAGGVCLNVGCIPTKALVERAEIFNSLSELKSMGIRTDKSELNYAKVQKKAQTASTRLSKGISFLLEKNKVDYIQGEARKIEPSKVTLDDGTVITGTYILLATGSSPRAIPGFETDEDRVLSSTGMLAMTELPRTLTILGSGAIGIEFAYIMNSFGVKVTVVELLPRILPLEDREISEAIEASLSKQGIKFIKGTGAERMEKKDDAVDIVLSDEEKTVLSADKVLVAIGRKPNTDRIDLSLTDISINSRGFIETGDYYETGEKNIFAIGDILPSAQLAHVASMEAEIAVAHIAGKVTVERIDDTEVPSAVYCEPQAASFGMKEPEEENAEITVSRFPFTGNGKAKATGHSEGLVKIVSDKEGHILGAHIAGRNASEMIHELLLAKKEGITLDRLAEMIHVHPSLSESIMEASKEAYDGAIHL